MSAGPIRTAAPGEHLAQDREAAGRHEYLDGEIFAMIGASEAHNTIVVEQYSRSAGGTWTLREYRLGSDAIALVSFGCDLSVGHVYEEVEIGRAKNEM